MRHTALGDMHSATPLVPRLTPDHSFHHHDSQPYWLRTGDSWKKIDYTQSAKSWMEPLKRGETTGMVEIPANWDVSLVQRCSIGSLSLNV